MNASCVLTDRPEYGVIVLGNSGSGKSYICNMIIGEDRFETDCRREAVTTTTEHHRITTESSDLLIYNVPGLIESHHETIERNKREISKAFKECSVSVVIFVWTQVDGRPSPDDIITFKALYEAFKFSHKSLMFAINKVPCKRERTFEGRFLALLLQMLNKVSIHLEDMFFIETLNSEDDDKFDFIRDRLLYFIAQHHEAEQRMYADIVVQYNELQALRIAVKEQLMLIEANKQAFEFQIEHLVKEYKVVRKEQEKSYHNLVVELQSAKKQNMKEQLQLVEQKIDHEKGIKQKMEKCCQIAKDQMRIRCKGIDFATIAISGGGSGAVSIGIAGAASGAVVGAVTGAVAGAVVGAVACPCVVVTTAVGAAAGAVAGAAIGGVSAVISGRNLAGAIITLYKNRRGRCHLKQLKYKHCKQK